MANYSKVTDFAAKDALLSGDPLKLVKGTEIDAEFDLISDAVATKANSSNAVLTGGSINGIVIGATTPLAITGTTITANVTFSGPLTGDVTGNVTGNTAGIHTGDTVGDVTGNLTASSGTTTVNNLVVNGTVDFTDTILTNLAAPSADTDAATKLYVDTSVAGLIDSAPAALDTLNELAAALGDDADFAGTITTSLATKLDLAGGTMTGAVAMSTNKITGLGDPTSAQDAATQAYVQTQDALNLNLTGGTLSGALAMGTNKITGIGEPTLAQDATSKSYVDGILGSATAASDSAAAAAISESNAATSETNAADSETAAALSASSVSSIQTTVETIYDQFDDRYLGPKASAPSVDNDGDVLVVGTMYFDTTSDAMEVYDGASWVSVAPVATSVTVSQISDYTGTATELNYTGGVTSAIQTQLDSKNALPTLKGTSYTANVGEFIVASAGGITITLPASPSAGDTVTIKDGTGAAAATTFTVARNGSNIASSATDLVFDKNFAEITMSYIDGTIGWSV